MVIATFVYDGDGRRVKQTLGGATTAFVGEYYEVGSSVRKNYHAGGQLVAYRDGSGLRFVLGDHLGSSSLTADASGGSVVRQLYKAWGYILSIGKMDKRRANRPGEKPVREKADLGQDARPGPELFREREKRMASAKIA